MDSIHGSWYIDKWLIDNWVKDDRHADYRLENT